MKTWREKGERGAVADISASGSAERLINANLAKLSVTLTSDPYSARPAAPLPCSSQMFGTPASFPLSGLLFPLLPAFSILSLSSSSFPVCSLSRFHLIQLCFLTSSFPQHFISCSSGKSEAQLLRTLTLHPSVTNKCTRTKHFKLDTHQLLNQMAASNMSDIFLKAAAEHCREKGPLLMVLVEASPMKHKQMCVCVCVKVEVCVHAPISVFKESPSSFANNWKQIML